MTEAIPSFGTLLKRGDGGTPEVFTAIAECGNIEGPGLKTNFEDATHHGSPGRAEEKLPTTITAGQIKFPVAFIPTNATHSYAAGLVKDWQGRTLRNYQLVFPDTGSTTWTLSAYIGEINIKGMVKGKLTADVVLEVTGLPTLA